MKKNNFPAPLPPTFFSPCYLCSKSGQVVLIISSAQQTPGCMRFLLASPKLRADIVFKASLFQRQEQLCCTALPVDVRALFLLKQMGFLMASVSFSMRTSRSHFPTQWPGKKKKWYWRKGCNREEQGWMVFFPSSLGEHLGSLSMRKREKR